MFDDEKEQTNVSMEADETEEVSEPSETEDEVSKDTTESEKEDRKPDSKKKEKEDEETYEQKVERLAQSKADKSLKTYQKSIQEKDKEIANLKLDLSESTWTRAINSLFDEESESKGVEEAAKNKKAREEAKKQNLEYLKNKDYVEKAKSELESRESILNIVERDQKARNELFKLYFPDDAEKIDKIEELVLKFDKCQDPEDFEIVLQGIKSELKGKTKKFKPDSSKNESGGISWKNMDEDQKMSAVQKALNKEK